MRGAGKMTAETYLMYGDDGIADRNDADEQHYKAGKRKIA